jgi:hypothetical protein
MKGISFRVALEIRGEGGAHQSSLEKKKSDGQNERTKNGGERGKSSVKDLVK